MSDPATSNPATANPATPNPETSLLAPTSSSPQSVLVVGAGPVGLVAACELARQGVMPRLIDTLPEPTTQYRAVGVQPRSQEMMAALGVLDRIRSLALPQVAIEIDAPRPNGFETLTRVDLTGLPSRFPTLLNLPQTDTEAVLRERAAELGVVIERGVSLTELTMDDTGVDVVLSTPTGEERARVDWIVAADGGHSTVRAAVGSKLEGSFHGTHFVVADVSIEADFARDTTRLFAAPDGLTVMMCMLHNRTRLLFQIPDPGTDAPTPTLEDIQRLAHQRMGGNVRVYDPESISYYTIHHAQVPNYRVDRALLAGDAAHIHSPAGGQGMNTGMQDAANLAWKLALVCRGLAEPKIMDSYHNERHPVGADVVRRTTMMANGMTLSGPAALARNAVMKTVGHLEGLRQVMAESISEVSVAYPNSPITAATGHRPHRAPAPGSHAADLAGLTTMRGEAVSIGDLLQEPGHLLLALTDDPASLEQLADALGPIGRVIAFIPDTASLPSPASSAVPPITSIADPEGALASHYGVGPHGLALVRPDGYLGYLSTTIDPDALQEYLSTRLHAVTNTPVRV